MPNTQWLIWLCALTLVLGIALFWRTRHVNRAQEALRRFMTQLDEIEALARSTRERATAIARLSSQVEGTHAQREVLDTQAQRVYQEVMGAVLNHRQWLIAQQGRPSAPDLDDRARMLAQARDQLERYLDTLKRALGEANASVSS